MNHTESQLFENSPLTGKSSRKFALLAVLLGFAFAPALLEANEYTYVKVGYVTYQVWTDPSDPSKIQSFVWACDKTAVGPIDISPTIGGGLVTSFVSQSFSDCTGVTSITIPSTVKTISTNTFNGCTGLKTVTLQYGLTDIGDWAFSGCTSLTGIILPDSVTSTGGGAFNGCTSLTSATLSGGLTNIADQVFRGCTSLASIDIPPVGDGSKVEFSPVQKWTIFTS